MGFPKPIWGFTKIGVKISIILITPGVQSTAPTNGQSSRVKRPACGRLPCFWHIRVWERFAPGIRFQGSGLNHKGVVGGGGGGGVA